MSATAPAPLAGEADLRTDDTNVSEVVRIASNANGQELCSESEILRAWSKSKTVPEGGRGVLLEVGSRTAAPSPQWGEGNTLIGRQE